MKQNNFMPKMPDMLGDDDCPHIGYWRSPKEILFKAKDLIIKYELGDIEKDKFIDKMKKLLFEY